MAAEIAKTEADAKKKACTPKSDKDKEVDSTSTTDSD